MNITTSSKIWSHPKLLSVVHKVNEIIEREAGPKSETLASLTAAEALQVTVVNAVS